VRSGTTKGGLTEGHGAVSGSLVHWPNVREVRWEVLRFAYRARKSVQFIGEWVTGGMVEGGDLAWYLDDERGGEEGLEVIRLCRAEQGCRAMRLIASFFVQPTIESSYI